MVFVFMVLNGIIYVTFCSISFHLIYHRFIHIVTYKCNSFILMVSQYEDTLTFIYGHLAYILVFALTCLSAMYILTCVTECSLKYSVYVNNHNTIWFPA